MDLVNQDINRSKESCSNVAPGVNRLIWLSQRGFKVD